MWKLLGFEDCSPNVVIITSSSFEPLWIYNYESLEIIRKYICGKHFEPFGFLLRNIWRFEISTLIYRFGFFGNDIFLWSPLIKLKLWRDVKCMSNMSPKISSCLEMLKIILKSFVIRSQLKVSSKQCQDLPFDKTKWSKILRTRSIHVFPCYNQF
jgi:hypothetical protein